MILLYVFLLLVNCFFLAINIKTIFTCKSNNYVSYIAPYIFAVIQLFLIAVSITQLLQICSTSYGKPRTIPFDPLQFAAYPIRGLRVA